MVFNPAVAQLEALRGHYQLHFVDRPRATRSLAMLTQLREGLAGLAHATDAKLRASAQQLAQAWRAEEGAIALAQSQAQSGDLQAIAALEESRRLLGRVARLQVLHPQPLAARPHQLALLSEEVAAGQAACKAAQDGAVAASPALAQAQQNLGHALGHLQALRAGALAARHASDAKVRLQAGVLAAKAVLADLAETVAGRSPVVVRPSYLEALIEDLQQAQALLQQQADEGLGGPEHPQNCAALAEQVAVWRLQLRQVVAKRRQYTADELAHALAEEADLVMEAADGVAPGSQGGARAYLGLRMDELHRQLQAVPLLFGQAQHQQTLAGLADCLAYLLL